MSDEDISVGSSWANELSQELRETDACIVCLTPENMNSTWLHFEAGEVAKVVKRKSLVCPFLLGVQKKELVGPLGQFQAANADRSDTLRVVRALNAALSTPIIQQERIEKIFDMWWPQLEAALKSIDLYPFGAFDRVKLGISSIIHSSNLPMFFSDHELVLRECNDELASLLNTTVASLLGQPVRVLIEKFANRAPRWRRTEFLKNNLALADMMAADLGPHLEAVEFIDNRELIGNRYNGLYRVRIHADKVTAERGGTVLGVFIVYFVEQLQSDDSIPH
jgi:hypothetical protein